MKIITNEKKCLNSIIVMPQKVSMGNRNRREKKRMRKPVFESPFMFFHVQKM